MKICSRCHKQKELELFGNVKTSKDGHSCYCKPCRRIIANDFRTKKALNPKHYFLKRSVV